MAWCFGAQACASAAAQLIAGNRDPARELLKFLAQTQHPDGGIPAYHPLGGLVSAPDAPSTVAFLELAARLLVWTGDLDGLRRLGEPLAGALEFLAETAAGVPSVRVLDALDSLVDGAGAGMTLAVLRRRAGERPATAEVQAHAVVEAAAAALRRAPGALPGPERRRRCWRRSRRCGGSSRTRPTARSRSRRPCRRGGTASRSGGSGSGEACSTSRSGAARRHCVRPRRSPLRPAPGAHGRRAGRRRRGHGGGRRAARRRRGRGSRRTPGTRSAFTCGTDAGWSFAPRRARLPLLTHQGRR